MLALLVLWSGVEWRCRPPGVPAPGLGPAPETRRVPMRQRYRESVLRARCNSKINTCIFEKKIMRKGQCLDHGFTHVYCTLVE